jgi:hypothetical protein
MLYLFLNPSWLTFLSNSQSLPNNRCVAYIEKTSHITSSLKFLMWMKPKPY